MDSPWEDVSHETTHQDVEWTRISSNFTNTGYREGITAGKESALQEGFDTGFALVGAPLGRQLGLLRGIANGITTFLNTHPEGLENCDMYLVEVRQISSQLSNIRFSDIMPVDKEAEEHARQHLEAEGDGLDLPDGIADKRTVESLEDMLATLTTGNRQSSAQTSRPSMGDVLQIETRLRGISGNLGLASLWSLLSTS